MANFAQALDHQKRSKHKPELDHLRVYQGDGKDGGHIVEHHMDRYGSSEPERFPFEAHEGAKPKLPKGHVLHHIAKHMGIEHEVLDADGDGE